MSKFTKGDLMLCVAKDAPHWDYTIGKIYEAAADSYVRHGTGYVELVRNDSDEPCYHFRADCFQKVRDDVQK